MSRYWAVVHPLLVLTAPGAHALTMEEALAEALRANPGIEAARDIARRYRENVVARRADFLPRVDVSACETSVSAFGGRNTTDAGFESAAISVSQNPSSSGRNRALGNESEQLARQGDAERMCTEREILLEVAAVYLDLARAQRVVGVREGSLRAFSARAAATRAQFDVHDRTRADVAQADAENDLAVPDLAAATADLKTLAARFESLVGMPPGMVTYPSPLPPVSETLEEVLALANDHPSVLSTEHALEAARNAVKAERARSGPHTDLRARLTETRNRIGTDRAGLQIGRSSS